jgi:hypothetical protein
LGCQFLFSDRLATDSLTGAECLFFGGIIIQ